MNYVLKYILSISFISILLSVFIYFFYVWIEIGEHPCPNEFKNSKCEITLLSVFSRFHIIGTLLYSINLGILNTFLGICIILYKMFKIKKRVVTAHN